MIKLTKTDRASLTAERRAYRIAALAAVVGDDGSDNLGVIVDHADPGATIAELVKIVRDARAALAAAKVPK